MALCFRFTQYLPVNTTEASCCNQAWRLNLLQQRNLTCNDEEEPIQDSISGVIYLVSIHPNPPSVHDTLYTYMVA